VSAEKMLERIDIIRKSGNSIGGVVTCVARNVPAGLGAPVFDKLEADLAKACMSIPAAKGFESGDGFEGTLLTGKEHNDEFYVDPKTGATRTKTNRSGGIQGGISNGENIVIHVAFKPTSTIGQLQVSVASKPYHFHSCKKPNTDLFFLSFRKLSPAMARRLNLEERDGMILVSFLVPSRWWKQW
jgi:chorismate synthase